MTTLEANTNWTATGSEANLVSIEGEETGNVALDNLCIKGSKGSGVNAQSKMTTHLNNVALEGNAKAGLLVHSVVVAEGLVTKNNFWGGVNVGTDGTPVYSPKFTFSPDCSFAESSKIWSEDTKTDPDQLVEGPNGWTSYVGVQGANTKEMRYWTNSKLISEFYQQFPNKTGDKWNKGYTFIYANGNPITIEQGSTADLVKISVDNTDDVLEVETSKNPVVFGGSKNATVSSSKITMKSGKVMNLFGGGYGESNGSTAAATAQPAGVTGNTVINVSGGEAHNILGGGLYYSKSNTVNITISKVTMDVNAWVMCGGMESGLTTAGKYPTFNKCTNTVDEGTLTITGGTFCYVCVGGTDGWGGYVKKATANISGTADSATSLVGIFGNGSNGGSDEVIGTLTGCTFTSMAGGYDTEIASINRGHVKDVTLNFNKCIFPESVIAYIGGTKGWKKDYKSSDVEVVSPGTVSFSFNECTNTPTLGLSDGLDNANVTVAGAPVQVASFDNGMDAKKTAFTIVTGKTWNLNGGLTFATGDNAATLTNGGTLNVTASTPAMLQDALTAGANKVNLDATNFELTSNLEITNPIALIGTVGTENAITTITQATQAGSATTGDNLVTVKSTKNVSLENIKITKSDNYGLHVFNSDSVRLTNVTLSDNKAGGLLVNGSTVTADKLTTENNAWGGIEVGKGEGVTKEPKLTISNSTLKETSSIWADTDPSKEGSEKVAEWVAGTGWNMFVEQPSGKEYKQTFWSQKTKIQINVTKSTFFYDGEVKNVTYTVTPEDVTDVTVTYKTIAENPTVVEADTIKNVGSYYVIFTREADATYLALNDTVTMSINAKGVPVIKGNLPKATSVEAGQPLSMSFLEGGKAVVSGTEVLGSFSWADANMIMQEGDNKCAVVFTPANLAEMEVAVDTIVINAKRYFTVTTGVSANGKAVIANKSTSDRYARGTQLNFTITPETGYEFTGWNEKTDHKETSYTVGQDTSFVAGFTKKKFTVTVTDPGNSNALAVKYKDANGSEQTVSSPAILDYGTILTVTATAAQSYNAEAISATGSTLSKGQIFLDANTTISATFVAKPETPKTVTVTAPEGGTIRLTDKETGKEVVAGSSVKSGTAIIIERTPNKGYKLADATQARTEQTVSDNVTITASFEKEVYTITAKTGTGYTLNVDKSTGYYGDQVKVGYQIQPGYKAVALMVNAKEVPNNSTFTLTENTTVQVIVKEKATVAVKTDEQSYVYNSYNQAFVVKTTPAGLDSVSVSYTKNGTTVSTPIDAGTYTVHINRPEDENFKALNVTATLKITPAPIVITARPTAADGTGGVASVAGAWASGSKPSDPVQPMTKALKSTDPSFAIFTPTSTNYAVGYCAPGSTLDMKVSITQPAVGGTITVWDGNLQIAGDGTGNNALKNTELRAIATPAEGYKFSGWTSGITSDGDKTNASATVTPSDNITFAATFVEKVTLTPSVTENASAEYDGTVKGGNLTISANTNVTDGWSYSFQQNGMTVIPVNAGKYDVVVTRAADADNKACRVVLTGAFEIKKATPVVATTPVATVVKGAMLHSAEVTGGAASTDGTFVWKSSNEAVNADATDKVMVFVPSDTDNFSEVDVTGVKVKTTDLQVISFVQPENGTIVVKRGETVLVSGDPIASGDKLTISVKPASGYELQSLTVAGTAFTNGGEYTVSGDATVNVVAVMKKTQTGGGTTEPETVAVSSVSLDKTELTLPRLDTYTLKATVNPSDATNKSVTWKSSDESIVKVDADGKVTALKVGKATITVTTVDGGKTATCQVTVDFATGLEEALANTEVFGRKGNIYVNPIQPLQVTVVNMIGKIVYNARISGNTQIPVTKGIYIVKLTNAGNTIVTKVNVY
ncbi:Ig-like domain-containing protein [Parabacteroides sp.]